MEQRVKIYCNKKVFVGWIIIILVVHVGGWIFLYWLLTNHFTEKVLPCNVILLGAMTTLNLICIITWLFMGTEAHMIFTKEGIEFRRWFKKPEFHPYRDYPYVEKAFYMYYGMPMYYIVLSNWRLSETQRASINWGASTVDCIKIRYKKKEYEALMSIVPPRIASTIRAKFNDVPFGKFDFLFL